MEFLFSSEFFLRNAIYFATRRAGCCYICRELGIRRDNKVGGCMSFRLMSPKR